MGFQGRPGDALSRETAPNRKLWSLFSGRVGSDFQRKYRHALLSGLPGEEVWQGKKGWHSLQCYPFLISLPSFPSLTGVLTGSFVQPLKLLAMQHWEIQGAQWMVFLSVHPYPFSGEVYCSLESPFLSMLDTDDGSEHLVKCFALPEILEPGES